MPNWSDVLKEIHKTQETGQSQQQQSFDLIRRKYLKKLHKHTGRNVIAYYSAFLSKPQIEGIDIVDDDKNGFMMAVHQLDRTKGLDILLHTPGGNMAATESLVHYLKSLFGNDIRAIVPQIAMSAGTMIACCCKSIVMGKHSNLGPIDPQINGIPAVVVKREFERAFNEMKADPARAMVWQPIISKYHPTFLDQCDLAIKWAATLVRDGLSSNMLYEEPKPLEKADVIVEKLSDVDENKAHNKHIHFDDCKQIGLTLEKLEDDEILQDLVLTVHHCFMHTLSNTEAVKIIENHRGKAIIRQVSQAKNNQISIGFGRPT